MKRLSWKYLAGLIDGEACLDYQIHSKCYVSPRLRITFAENSKFVLDYLVNSFGGYIEERKREFSNPNWQNAVCWQIHGYKLLCPILRNLVNHLEIKKQQARFILWCERNVKGSKLPTEVAKRIRDELKPMKRDPHRLSEVAQKNTTEILQSSNLK